MKAIKELLVAHYDPKTKQILNCRKNSLAYLHEERHHKQMSNKIIYWIQYWFYLLGFVFALFFVIIGLFNNLLKGALAIAGICFMPHVIFTVLLEVDAWIYSTFKYLVNRVKTQADSAESVS